MFLHISRCILNNRHVNVLFCLLFTYHASEKSPFIDHLKPLLDQTTNSRHLLNKD